MMKKIQKIARILGFCVLLASVSVALNACSTTTTGDKTVIVKKAPHAHKHRHKHRWFWWR